MQGKPIQTVAVYTPSLLPVCTRALLDLLGVALFSLTMCSVTPAMVIRGGGIPIDAAVTASLVLFTETVEEKEFVELEMKYRCKLFLRDKERMVKHIVNLRNAATEGKMGGLSSLDDANADAAIQQPMPKRPKKQLVDEIDRILTVHVKTAAGNEADVNVLSSWYKAAPLKMECSNENFELLLEDPCPGQVSELNRQDCGPFTPTISNQVCYWVPTRKVVRFKWYCDAKRDWQIKSFKVIFMKEDSDEDKQAAVDSAIDECIRFRNRMHTDPPEEEQ